MELPVWPMIEVNLSKDLTINLKAWQQCRYLRIWLHQSNQIECRDLWNLYVIVEINAVAERGVNKTRNIRSRWDSVMTWKEDGPLICCSELWNHSPQVNSPAMNVLTVSSNWNLRDWRWWLTMYVRPSQEQAITSSLPSPCQMVQ